MVVFFEVLGFSVVCAATLSWEGCDETDKVTTPGGPVVEPSVAGNSLAAGSFTPVCFVVTVSSFLAMVPIIAMLLVGGVSAPEEVTVVTVRACTADVFALRDIFTAASSLLAYLAPSELYTGLAESYYMTRESLLFTVESLLSPFAIFV